jgi:septum site-determining protein MinD
MNISDEDIPESAFASMINDVREDFDFIIIDSCAEMTDYYKKFARQADEAIIVTLHQTTSVRAAEKTASRLSAMGIKDLGLVVNGFRENFAENGRLPSIIDIINRSSVKLIGVVPYSEKLQASQEAAELSFMGEPRKKAKDWEAAFYNIASRICGKRINLFEGIEKTKRRYKYEGITYKVLYDFRED